MARCRQFHENCECSRKLRRRRLGQMRPLGLESVFVGYVRHGVHYPVCARVRELPPDGNRLVLRTRVLQLALFLLGNAVAGFVTEKHRKLPLMPEKQCVSDYAKLYPSIPMLSLSYLSTVASASLFWGAATATATRAAKAMI